MKTNFIDKTIKLTIVLNCVVVRSRAKSCAVFSRRLWRHLRENCRIKITSKNRNCGDAKFFLIYCRKRQRTNAKSERAKGRGLAICRRRKMYAMIGPILRTDFCAQPSYSIDIFIALVPPVCLFAQWLDILVFGGRCQQ